VRRSLLFVVAAALLAGLGIVSSDPASASAAGSKVLVLDHGRVSVRHDPFLQPADPIQPTAADAQAARDASAPPVLQRGQAMAAASRLTVSKALKGMLDRGGIDREHYDKYLQDYQDARASMRKLTGTRRSELTAVVGNLEALAASGKLTSSRAPLAFLTVRRNNSWWNDGRLLGYGERVEFGSSIIQWQSYPGQGIQLQWLGTFGKANALWSGGKRYNEKLKTLLGEITPLATARAGGIAWEYQFRFDGGSPPWASAMAQGTAIQAYARAATRLDDKSYYKVAKAALGIYRTAPPTGVRLKTSAGAHYLMYSFTTGQRILNGFVQSLNGLHDYAEASGDKTAASLFKDGERQARSETRETDTGAWSLYQLGGSESDLSYHTLLRDFLLGLCDRLKTDKERGEKLFSAPSSSLYCSTGERFTSYLKEPPRITVRALPGAKVGASPQVRIGVSKISTVTLTVLRGGTTAATKSVTLPRGNHTVSWGPNASKPGTVALSVRAVDLAGNVGTKTGSQTVKKK